MPEGKTVDRMAGEEVPKLIRAFDESKSGIEVTELRLTDKDSGIPEVVRSE